MSAKKPGRALTWTGVTAAVVGFPTLLLLIMGDPISKPKWDRIQIGMTKAQVIEVLGPPDATEGTWQFEYHGFLNVGWVEFDFDEQGRLREKNDESVNRSLDRTSNKRTE
jgi:hypothetical protein